jgi:alpha-L-rhamnosidase
MTLTQAVMIAPDQDFDGAPLLRGQVARETGHGEVAAARLTATAHGVFEAYVGGLPAGDDVLSPGWSAYEWRLRLRTYDVTEAVRAAGPRIVVGLALGNGWFRGNLGSLGNHAVYGSELAGLAELEITYADGHIQTAGTDLGWRSGPSAVLANDLYNGQMIDARRFSTAWLQPGAELPGWTGVHAVDVDRRGLTPYVGPAVRRQQTVAAQRIWTSPTGKTLVDFGQNLVGWLRLRARGETGSMVTVRHAEVLEHGELGTRPLRSAEATDRFILSGGDDETASASSSAATRD